MKKFFMCAMAAVAMLSVSSCLSEEEVNFTRGQEKGEGYGYINLNATTEDVVVTRASYSGNSLYTGNTWYAKVSRIVGNETEYGWSDTENGNDFKALDASFATTPFAADTWTINVCNYKSADAALAANVDCNFYFFARLKIAVYYLCKTLIYIYNRFTFYL